MATQQKRCFLFNGKMRQLSALLALLVSFPVVPVFGQMSLQPGATAQGRIDSTTSPVNVNGTFRPGVQYTFEVQAGDFVQIAVSALQGSQLKPLLYITPSNRNGFFSNSSYKQESVQIGGIWAVSVVPANPANAFGDYTIALVIKRDGKLVEPKKVKDPNVTLVESWGLIHNPECDGNVVYIYFGEQRVCTRPDPASGLAKDSVWKYDAVKQGLVPLGKEKETESLTPQEPPPKPPNLPD